jgi:hypothetical protein
MIVLLGRFLSGLSSNRHLSIYVHDYCVCTHSWHIGDKTFAKDFLATIHGDVDRFQIGTREVVLKKTLSDR